MTWFIMNVMLQDNKRSACITTSCRFFRTRRGCYIRMDRCYGQQQLFAPPAA